MSNKTPEQNKAFALRAFDTLFNKRDYDAAAPIGLVVGRGCGGDEADP
jgi:hypothetical protein